MDLGNLEIESLDIRGFEFCVVALEVFGVPTKCELIFGETGRGR